MLFADTSPLGVQRDLQTIYALVTGFCARFPDASADLNTNRAMGVMFGMRQDFPHRDGIDKASPFKKAANFVCNWIAAKPITLSPSPFEHVNEVFALMVAIESLHGATLGGDRTLSNRIELSRHSLLDIIEALANVTPVTHFKLVSVLLEQMAYKTNSDCQYPNVLTTGDNELP